MEKILQTLQHFINEFKEFKKQDEHIILAKLWKSLLFLVNPGRQIIGVFLRLYSL